MKLSNKFTFVRVFFAPVFFVLYFFPIWTGNFTRTSVYLLLPLLLFAEVTDYLDGHYARKLKEVSDFGKMFDPFADVILHLTSFACFVQPGIYGHPDSQGYMPLFLFLLLFYREFAMNFVRMVAAKQGVAIAARKGGKLKTVLYIVTEFYTLAIECALRLNLPVNNLLSVLKLVDVGLFIACVVMSYLSFADYLFHFSKVLNGSVNKKSEKK